MIESSILMSLVLKCLTFCQKKYQESLVSHGVNKLLHMLTNLLEGSRILSYFSLDFKASIAKENGLILGYFSHAGQWMKDVFAKRVVPSLEASLIVGLIDRLDIHLIMGTGLIGTMLIFPTTLSVAVAIGVIVSYVYMYLRGNLSHLNESIVFKLLGAYVVFILLNTITGLKGSDATLIGLIYGSYLVAAWTIGKCIKDEKHLIWLLRMMMVMTLVACLYGVYQYLIGVEVDPAWVDEELFDTMQTRIYSFFGNPNVFGIFLVLMAPIAFALTFSEKHWFFKLFYGGIFGLSVICIGLTYSRGSMIGLAAALAIMLVFMDRRFLLLGIAGVVMLPFVLPASIIDRLMSIGNLQDSSSAYRVSIYQASIHMIEDFLYGGVGLGGFNKVYFAYAFSASKAFHAHNTFLMVLLEQGIFGFIVFMTMMVTWVKELMSTVMTTSNKRHKYLLLAFGGGIVGASAQGLVEHIWHNYDVMFFYWLILLLGVGLARMSKREADHV